MSYSMVKWSPILVAKEIRKSSQIFENSQESTVGEPIIVVPCSSKYSVHEYTFLYEPIGWRLSIGVVTRREIPRRQETFVVFVFVLYGNDQESC